MNAYIQKEQITSIGGNIASEPERVREIPQELGRMAFEIEQLEAAIGKLASRLSPVLRPIPQVKKDEVKESTPATSLACEFQRLSHRVRSVQIAITGMADDAQL
jgi:hypothetical protein